MLTTKKIPQSIDNTRREKNELDFKMCTMSTTSESGGCINEKKNRIMDRAQLDEIDPKIHPAKIQNKNLIRKTRAFRGRVWRFAPLYGRPVGVGEARPARGAPDRDRR